MRKILPARTVAGLVVPSWVHGTVFALPAYLQFPELGGLDGWV